jgi:alanyl-tRNA synthetase
MTTSFSAIVTDVRLYSRKDGESLWQIALDSTAFSVGRGVGTLTAHAMSGAILVIEVISVSEDEHGDLWHLASKPLLIGTRVVGEVC